MSNPNALVQAHLKAGRFIAVDGLQAFVREAGQGEAVLCIHGVPSSSFLYRKMLAELAAKGYRGIAFDLPGLGFSDRPEDFDYTWTGLGKWSVKACQVLGLDKFHLVIHDLGGPVGLEIAAALPERILSLTILNTILANLGSFKKPIVMKPFEWKGIGELYLKTLVTPLFQQLMYLQGVQQKSEFGHEEAEAWVSMLKQKDQGHAFLKIMRCFEATPEKEQLYTQVVKDLNIPKQIIWGAKDPALPARKFAYPLQKQLGIERLSMVPSKHFLQEDCAPEIVERFVEMLQD